MKRTLSFFGYDGLTREEINSAYKDLIELLTTLDPQVVMNIANSVWIREGFPVKEPFLFFIRENNTNTILFLGLYTGIE